MNPEMKLKPTLIRNELDADSLYTHETAVSFVWKKCTSFFYFCNKHFVYTFFQCVLYYLNTNYFYITINCIKALSKGDFDLILI